MGDADFAERKLRRDRVPGGRIHLLGGGIAGGPPIGFKPRIVSWA